MVADIQQRFSSLVRDLSLPCAARLDKLATDSVQLVYPYQPRQARNKVRRDWSPESIALEIHLKRVRHLRTILGSRHAIMDGQLRRALRFSTERLRKLARSPEQLELFEGLTIYNSAFWDGVRGEEVRMVLAGAQAEISAKLTVGMRRDRRKRFLISIQKKNYGLQLGKLKGAVLATLGAKKKSFKLESLKDGDSTILSPGNIHAIVQRYMTEWFAFPADGSAPPDWEVLLNDESQFTVWARDWAVPSRLISVLWQTIPSITSVPTVGSDHPDSAGTPKTTSACQKRISGRDVGSVVRHDPVLEPCSACRSIRRLSGAVGEEGGPCVLAGSVGPTHPKER